MAGLHDRDMEQLHHLPYIVRLLESYIDVADLFRRSYANFVQ